MTEKQYKLWLKSMKFGKACGCHQKSNRSFHINGVQLPFCARCTGIIIGEFVFAPILFLLGYDWILMSILFIAIMATDGLIQYYTTYESTNTKRVVTGILAGIGYMLLTVQLILFIVSKV